jgi:hypothetical protein
MRTRAWAGVQPGRAGGSSAGGGVFRVFGVSRGRVRGGLLGGAVVLGGEVLEVLDGVDDTLAVLGGQPGGEHEHPVVVVAPAHPLHLHPGGGVGGAGRPARGHQQVQSRGGRVGGEVEPVFLVGRGGDAGDLTSGRVVFDGQDISRLSRRAPRPIRCEMQMIFQDPYGSLNPRRRVGSGVEEDQYRN